MYEHVEDVAVGPVWYGGAALCFYSGVYVAYGVYSLVGLGGSGEDDLPGIVDGGKEAAEGIFGQLACEVEPVYGFVAGEFGGGTGEDEEDDVGTAPYLPDDGVGGGRRAGRFGQVWRPAG